MCSGTNPILLTNDTYLFALSSRFNKSALMTPVKAASTKLFCICLAGFGLSGSLTEYKVCMEKSHCLATSTVGNTLSVGIQMHECVPHNISQGACCFPLSAVEIKMIAFVVTCSTAAV